VTDQAKPPVFLLDTMSFIFRAYHAMQRSRPMSTRAGLPTAAIYVFVNMIKKLRQDFQPLYFAAVFDVSGEVFRDERARTMGPLRKWNGKTQSFDEVSYEGYKANRAAMPEDLRRQIPYIRRALEALRIPILEAEGFEADDVIGTLAREAAAEEHEVFIVSGDKDMMQLVTPQVRILNPQKDNLILDPDKVTETLGVPPEKVVDVMALRGDAVDNIPGAPGIGDKGSVDLIREFGSVEAVLDRFAEVKRKGYRESLEQNRDAVLLSKELVTIDCHVPLELDLAAMETQPPNIEACRELFTELEFTSMLRDLTPSETAAAVELIEEPTDEQAAAFHAAARAHGFAFALNAAAPAIEAEDEVPQTMSLLDVAEAAEKQASFSVGVCADPATALELPLSAQLRALLEDAAVPKQTHDWKSALHALTAQGIALRGAVDDTMLLSYALNPTHTTQSLADVAARNGQPAPSTLAAGAAAIRALVPALKIEVEKAGVSRVYREIDLPLAPVLFRMLQHQFAQATRRGAVHSFGAARAGAPRQEQGHFNGAGCAGVFGRSARRSAAGAGIPASVQVEVNVHRCAAAAGRCGVARAYDLPSRGHGHGAALVDQPESPEHSHTHRTGAGDSRGIHRSARHTTAFSGLLADRVAPAGSLQRRSAAGACLPEQRGHSHADRQRGFRRACRNHGQADTRPRQGR
jgi:DNA polymerase-1